MQHKNTRNNNNSNNTGNNSTFNNSSLKENLTQLPLSKFILNKHLKMNLSINKHLQLDNFVYDKKEIEIKNKTNNSHSKDNSKKFESKKPLLITCEYKYTNNQNLTKKKIEIE